VQDDRPPCVVLITVDTLRLDFVEGERAEPTPAIDSLLADSVVFENARSVAPWTKPAVATLLTGLSPLVHRTTSVGDGLPEEVRTIAEYLRDAGYHTVGIGLNGHLDPSFNFHQGFDRYQFPARGDYGVSFGSMLLSRLLPNRYPEVRVSTEGIADVVVDWLRSNRHEHFFLWMHILDPHWPYWPPPAFAPPVCEDASIDDFWGDWDVVTEVQAGIVKLDDREKDRVRELYRAEIRYADANIRRLLDALKELDLYDGSLIAFASDHGEEFWEHGRYEHGHTLFDEVLRVPLSFKLPGSRFKTRIGTPVSTESLTPTLVDLLGLEPPGHGFSSPSLQGYWNPEVAPEPLTALFANGTYYYGEKMMVLLRGRWKYVVEADTGREELYDLLDDPGELGSLASSRPELVAEADALLAKRIASSDGLRRALRIEKRSAVQVSDGLRARLRALGYAGSAP
jgi:arylsulfatase A-like enzyme